MRLRHYRFTVTPSLFAVLIIIMAGSLAAQPQPPREPDAEIRIDWEEGHLSDLEHHLEQLEDLELYGLREVDLAELERELERLHMEMIWEGDLRDLEMDLKDMEADLVEMAHELSAVDWGEVQDGDLSEVEELGEHLENLRHLEDLNWTTSGWYSSLNEDDRLQLEALRHIPIRTPATAIPMLERVLTEAPHPAVRRMAVQKLGDIGAPEMVIPLLKRVVETDTDLRVRRQAIRQLGKINHPDAAAALDALLSK